MTQTWIEPLVSGIINQYSNNYTNTLAEKGKCTKRMNTLSHLRSHSFISQLGPLDGIQYLHTADESLC